MIVPIWIDTSLPQALDNSLAELCRAPEPFHLLAFLAEGSSGDVATLQQACHARHIRLAGAIFPQLIRDGQCGAAGMLLLKVTDAPPPLLLDNVGDAEPSGPTARKLREYVEGHLHANDEAALFCIFDAQVPNIATHLDTWYLTLADRVSYFGVNAGSETFAPIPCLFDNDKVIGQGLLLQLLPGHPGACLNHDYGVPETSLTATSAEGNRIVQIDWQPPLKVYGELMRECYGVEITAENFYEYAVHFPFGILRADGEVLVRIPVALGEDGSMFCVGEIPPNSMLTLLDARVGAHRAPQHLARDLLALSPAVTNGDLLLFYCAGRRMHLGDSMADELNSLATASHARHIYGALSLGEIGGSRSGGYPLFHNATLVGVPCR